MLHHALTWRWSLLALLVLVMGLAAAVWGLAALCTHPRSTFHWPHNEQGMWVVSNDTAVARAATPFPAHCSLASQYMSSVL